MPRSETCFAARSLCPLLVSSLLRSFLVGPQECDDSVRVYEVLHEVVEQTANLIPRELAYQRTIQVKLVPTWISSECFFVNMLPLLGLLSAPAS